MARKKKNLLEEVRSNLEKAIKPLTFGRRRWYLLAFFVFLIVVFGLGASLVIALGIAGIFAIIVIARSNEKWMREDSESKR
jgi:uncharacterized protein (DUF58 family)